MKKILIGAILASSFAMSGDLEKCSHAVNMRIKYSTLASEMDKKESELNRKNDMLYVEKYNELGHLYRSLFRQWRLESIKECKDILENIPYGFLDGYGY